MSEACIDLEEALAQAGTKAQKLTVESLRRLNLPAAGLAYILETGVSPPARKVGRKRRRNLILEVPLRNIPKVVLQAESMTGEYHFLVELERREDLLAVFDQPITIKISITDSRGRRTRTTYTVDYLVVDERRVCAYEIKSDSELQRLVRERPSDWRIDKDGYHYLPAAEYFKAIGIRLVVVPISSLSSLRADNLRLLSSARDVADTRTYRRARQGIRELLKNEPTMRVSEILERIGDPDETPILQLLNSEEIFADLDRVTLSDPSSVWVSTHLNLAQIAQESAKGLADLLRSCNLDTNDVMDPRHEAEVAARLAIIQGTTRLNSRGKSLSDRTIRRHRKNFRDSGGDVRSIVPQWENCGNSAPVIGNVHQSFLEAFIRAGKSDPNDPSIGSCFNAYQKAFPQARLEIDFFDAHPVCRSSFYTYWHRTSLQHDDSFSRGGRRLENEHADSFDPANKTIIATRPFAVAHIDHWKTDLHLVVGYINGAKITKRAWLTAMVDAFSGEVLAIWLSFSDPSKKACTMVLRDCVRRHGRLPEMIITDGGSDFKSAHFLVMLATFGVVRCERPPEDPRFGQQVERLFKDFKDRFVRGLPGFGISIERARAVSAAFKAQRNASLTLLEAFEAIESFVFQGHNNGLKPGDISSRLAIRLKADRLYPHSGKKVVWDLRFLIATSIESPDTNYKLWTGRGIHVYDKWYSSPRLLQYRGYKKDISVRLEPYADSVIYVCIEGKWLECRNSEAPLQSAMSESSLVCRTAERHDLSALRAELTNDVNRCAAEIVNEKLREIAGRRDSGESSSVTTDVNDQPIPEPPTFSPFNFDEIQPYDNEPRE